MPNKNLSIYGEGEKGTSDGTHLTVEIAKNHIACIATKNNKKTVQAFELFTFTEEEGEKFDDLLSGICKQSQLLSLEASSTRVYVNSEYCVPVPIFVFNKEIATEYLQLACGETGFSKVLYEHLPIDPGIINAYSIPQDRFDWINQNWKKTTFHHTYSSIIRRISGLPGGNSNLIIVQFYDTFMIAAAVKDGNLQLIQTFVYDKPEDVLYYLLNIAQQFDMFNSPLTVQISGMIDLEFKLYRELITYFKTVIVEDGDETYAKVNVGEHPVHYFTPFFNLAL